MYKTLKKLIRRNENSDLTPSKKIHFPFMVVAPENSTEQEYLNE